MSAVESVRSMRSTLPPMFRRGEVEMQAVKSDVCDDQGAPMGERSSDAVTRDGARVSSCRSHQAHDTAFLFCGSIKMHLVSTMVLAVCMSAFCVWTTFKLGKEIAEPRPATDNETGCNFTQNHVG